MKIAKISSIVLLGHVALVAVLLSQAGCNCFCPPSMCVKKRYCAEDTQFYSQEESTLADSFTTGTTHEATYTQEDGFDLNDSFSLATTDGPKRYAPKRPSWTHTPAAEPSSIGEEIADDQTLNPVFSRATQQETFTTYKVVKGDSLWLIARRHNTTVKAIADANSLNPTQVLKVGQELTIPSESSTYTASTTSKSSAPGGQYKIQSGDTLSHIAKRFNVSVDSIRSANGISGSRIVAGKTITIPSIDQSKIDATPRPQPSAPSYTASTTTNHEGNYVVKSGESLSVIAKRFGVSVSDLMQWNNISDARKLRAGQALQVSSDNAPLSGLGSSFEDAFTSKTAPSTEQYATTNPDLELFEDDNLFDLTDEIPLVSVSHD